MKKWIRYVPDRIDDGLRYLCGRMSPDVRLVCVVVMLTGFGCLSIYMTVSSIYRIGRHEGEQLQMEHIRRMELYRGINKDSINIKNQVDYGEPKNQERQPANAATPGKGGRERTNAETGEERGQTSDSGRDAQAEEDARVSVVLSRVSGSNVADIRSFGQRRAIKGGFNVDVPMPEDKGLLSDKRPPTNKVPLKRNKRRK